MARTKTAGNSREKSATAAAAEKDKSAAAVGPTVAALRHNPGIDADWTDEEQALLEELLTKYASETNVMRCVKIATQFNNKTARDVALRCRWMNKKEVGKRRKDDHNLLRKSRDKKERASDLMARATSFTAHQSNGPPYSHPVMPPDMDDGIPFGAIGGVMGQLLEQNAQALSHISANFSAYKVHENLDLLYQARSNILNILNDMDGMPGMQQMPRLPVRLQEDLANVVLGHPPSFHYYS